MIKTQFRSKFYKNVNDAMTDYGNYQMQLNLDNFNQLQKIDKSNIGTHKYFGIMTIGITLETPLLNKRYLFINNLLRIKFLC